MPPPSERRPRTRLRCEGLEARDVPAVITWTDGTGNHNFDTSDNWDLGRMPDSGDEVVFDGTVCNDDCNNTYSMTSYAAVRLVNGYSGTVTLDGWLITDTLELTSGTIDQPSPYPGITDIQVNSSFTWTGGTLNSTATAATLWLVAGAVGTITSSTTLIAGDMIDVGSGTTLTLNGGALTTNQPLNNEGGTVALKGSTTLTLGGSLPTTDNTYSQTGSSALLEIESGSKLVCPATKWASIWGGKLRTLYNSNLADTVTAQTATIDTRLQVHDATVQICRQGGVHYGRLYVTGNVDFLSGSYQAGVDADTNGRSDVWESGGSFTVGRLGGATDLWVMSSDDTPVANGTWQIIKSAGYTGNFTTTFLMYDVGPPVKSFGLSTQGTPATNLVVTTGP